MVGMGMGLRNGDGNGNGGDGDGNVDGEWWGGGWVCGGDVNSEV